MKNARLNAAIEERLNRIHEDKKQLVEAWNPYLKVVEAHFTKQGKEITSYEKMQIAQCLENSVLEGGMRNRSRLFETTYSDNITFLGVQLPVIAALLPSLVLNEIAIVQALDRRTGAIFYLDVKTGQAKGSLASGSTLIGSKTGHATGDAAMRYASELVYGEALTDADVCTGTLSYKPLRAGTLIITDGVSTFTANGSGVMVPDDSTLSNGTINITTGVYSVTFVGRAAVPTAAYQYVYEKQTAGVPEVDVTLTSETISALDFPLRAKYSMGAAIDLEKAHGLILENELIKYLAGEIRFEIDHYGIEQIVAAAEGTGAADTAGTFDAGIGTEREWVWHKFRFLDIIEKASNNIFAKTLRGQASYIICGNNAARLVRQLKPNFVEAPGIATMTPTGPYKLGTLDGRIVIQDPFLSTNKFYVGHKGDGLLMAGLVYAPYIPLFSTPTLITSDMNAQKGFLSAAGFKRVNDGFYTYGQVSNMQ